ncbi:DUF1328 domain-containing protein [Marinovum sp.]|uniref:DUF1328 domain-containing protein n=1 Tax=Marinovum sp. TaxID=2024839 RepID=UPI003A8FE3EB
MLGWALTFLVVAMAVGLLGIANVALIPTATAQIIFFVLIVLFIIALVMRVVRGKPPV